VQSQASPQLSEGLEVPPQVAEHALLPQFIDELLHVEPAAQFIEHVPSSEQSTDVPWQHLSSPPEQVHCTSQL
jgi:hypothetical protein